MTDEERGVTPIDNKAEAQRRPVERVIIGAQPSHYVSGALVAGPGDVHLADLLRAAATYVEARGLLDHEVAAVLWHYDGDRGEGDIALIVTS